MVAALSPKLPPGKPIPMQTLHTVQARIQFSRVPPAATLLSWSVAVCDCLHHKLTHMLPVSSISCFQTCFAVVLSLHLGSCTAISG